MTSAGPSKMEPASAKPFAITGLSPSNSRASRAFGTNFSGLLEAVMEVHDRVIEKAVTNEDDRQTLRNIFEQAARERLSQ